MGWALRVVTLRAYAIAPWRVARVCGVVTVGAGHVLGGGWHLAAA